MDLPIHCAAFPGLSLLNTRAVLVPVQSEMDSEAEAVVVICILIEEEKQRKEESAIGFTISTGKDQYSESSAHYFRIC
jgi:hypothetical protein